MNIRNIKAIAQHLPKIREVFRNEKGAIDLASIMVGIIVIGLIAALIAATIFIIIPWGQDRAAKQQLGSIISAQSAYFGLTASPDGQPTGSQPNSYAGSDQLEQANLLTTNPTYCTAATNNGKGFVAYAQSASGKTFKATNDNTNPSIASPAEIASSSCAHIAQDNTNEGDGNNGDNAGKTPTMTALTYRCDVDTTSTLPFRDNVKGTLTWGDGLQETYNGETVTADKTFEAGVEYKVVFDGTYEAFRHLPTNDLSQMNPQRDFFSPSGFTICLRSLDHWGANTGVKNADFGLTGTLNLTNVPNSIPPTIQSLRFFLATAGVKALLNPSDPNPEVTSLNDPNISAWNVSNVTDMMGMFYYGWSFNQPLNGWDVSNVTNMANMFVGNQAFNQPLDNWDVSNVTMMSQMFEGALAFNQPIGNWDVSNVTNMNDMFSSSGAFHQDISMWNTSSLWDETLLGLPNAFPTEWLPPNTYKYDW